MVILAWIEHILVRWGMGCRVWSVVNVIENCSISAWALKISQIPSVIPREVRNPNLPLKSEMFRFCFAPLNMTPCFYRT